MFKIRFWGVRGSYPSTGKNFSIGGNTTCVEVEIDQNVMIFDAGTGIIKLGKYLTKKLLEKKDLKIFIFFTHYHQDHIQGLPFFNLLYMPSVHLNFFGPKLAEKTLYENIMANMYMPFFPVDFEETLSKKSFNNLKDRDVVIIDPKNSSYNISEEYIEKDKKEEQLIKITAYKNFIHPKNGSFYYRIEFNNKKIVFATDIEGFVGGDIRLITASKNADILIHDSQYLPEVYKNPYFPTQGFGHATPVIASDVARQAGVKKLILTHHDPNSTDKNIKKIQTIARKYFKESYYAYEIMEIDLENNKTSKLAGF